MDGVEEEEQSGHICKDGRETDGGRGDLRSRDDPTTSCHSGHSANCQPALCDVTKSADIPCSSSTQGNVCFKTKINVDGHLGAGKRGGI